MKLWLILFLIISIVQIGKGESMSDAYDLSLFDEVEKSIPKHSELKLWGIQVGMYFGFQHQVKAINERLDSRSETLDEMYNFRNVLIKDNMLPPVVIRANQLFEKIDENTFHESSIIYRMRKPSMLSYNSPTWRDYIYLDPTQVQKPILPPGLKPKNKQEKNAWRSAVEKGINKGKGHALEVYELMLAELNEDYRGMVLAHHLYELNMLNMGDVNIKNKGTIVTEKEINVNDRIIVLEPNDVFIEQKKWKPFIEVVSDSKGGEIE